MSRSDCILLIAVLVAWAFRELAFQHKKGKGR
jgi:hypothetical protein